MQDNLIYSRHGKFTGGSLNIELLDNQFKVLFIKRKGILTLLMSLWVPN